MNNPLLDPLPDLPPIQNRTWGKETPLPTGTVTFLFTDIEGSTPLWEQMPGEMKAAVAQHHVILRQAIESNAGAVSQVIGDSFESAFRTATDGLSAAVAAQRALQKAEWGATGALKVRMGLHTGPAELDPKGDAPYAVSHTLNRTARIMSAGHGRQILLSQETADLVRRSLPEGMMLKDLGEHHLKGMEWLEHLYQVMAPGLQQDFPSLFTAATHPNNLPLQMTSFVGREKEIAEVIELLEKNRLVTLTGSGGTGKTRLAIRVAEQMLDQFPHGAWFIELAALSDPDLVPRTTITALGLLESTSQSLTNQLKNYLMEKNILLLLDNCEHVIEDCACLAVELLRACPGLKIMASSREALGVAGEIAYHVPSLSAPDPRQLPALEEINTFAAVHLFCERAASVQPGFTITTANAQAVAQVCRRLDGIPLAIELAAARINVLSVDQIAVRLNDRFRLLTGGSRTALPRQQTLRASIDWSFSLLNERERLLLMRLSVFYGGWTLEAASHVCVFAGLDEYEVIDGLAQLANKSLINVESEVTGDNRYRMLETIRQYAREKLFDSGEAGRVRNQHLDYFVHLAEKAEHQLRGPLQVAWLDRLEMEIDNLRACLEWALEGEEHKGLVLATALFWMWFIRGYRVEMEHWLDLFFEKLRYKSTGTNDLQLLVKSRIYQSFLRLATGGASSQTDQIVKEASALSDQLGEEGKLSRAYAVHARVWNAYLNNEPTAGFEQYLDGLKVAQELGDRFLTAEFLQHLSNFDPDLLRSFNYAEQNLAVRKEIGDLDGLMFAYMLLGDRHFQLGKQNLAMEMYLEAQNLARQVKNRWGIMLSQYGLGIVSCESGNFSESMAYFRQALTTALDYGEYVWTILASNALGHTMELSGDWDSARGYFDKAIETSRTNNDIDWEVRSCIILAEAAWFHGDFVLAESNYQAAKLAGQKKEGHNLSGLIAYGLGKSALMRGDLKTAKDYFRQSLEEAVRLRSVYEIRFNLEALSTLSVSEAGKAAQLRGVVENLRRIRSSFSFVTIFLAHFDLDTTLAPAKASLGEAEFERLRLEGREMTLEQAVALAMEEDQDG